MKKSVTDKRIVLSLLILLHLLILPFLLGPGLVYQNYFLALLLTVSIVYFYFQLRNAPAPSDHVLEKSDWLCLLCILMISGFLAARQMFVNSVWLDEYEEFRNVTYYLDLTHQAAFFQQPPLSYLLRKVGLIFGGQNELGLRISSVVGNVLFLIVMFFNIRKIAKDSYYALLSTLLLGFNYWIILYSVEARPYSISLYYFAVFLHFLIPELSGTGVRKSPNYGLIFATVFWLLSISMQPLIFVCWATFATLLWWLGNRKAKYLAVAVALVVALLLYLPFLSLIVENSKSYLQSTSRPFSEYILSFFNDLHLVKAMFFSNYFYYLIILQMVVLTGFSLFTNRISKRFLQAIAGFSIVYLLLIILLFEYKINWSLAERYLITIIPVFYFLFSIAFFLFREARHTTLKKGVLLQLVLVALGSYLYSKPVQNIALNWRGLYSALGERTTGSSNAYLFSFFTTTSGWSDEYFIGSELYPSPKISLAAPDLISFPTFTNNDFLYNNFSLAENRNELFFIISRHTFKASYFEKLKIDGAEKIVLDGFFVIKAFPPKSTLAMTKEFYSQLENIADETEIRVRAFDGLFLAALFEKNCGNSKHYLKKYSEIAKLSPYLALRTKLHHARYSSLCGKQIYR